MDKTTAPPFIIRYRMEIAILLLLLSVAGLLGARVVASVAMFLFGMLAIAGKPLRQWFQNRWWVAGCAWVLLFAASGFWSENLPEWWVHVQDKLPILLLPLAFGFMPRPTARQQLLYTGGITGLLLGGIAWSLAQAAGQWTTIVEEYRFSHLLPAPMYRHHIAFSTFLAMAMLLILQSWPLLARRWMRVSAVIALVVFGVYIHLLASRTGILCLYGLVLLFWVRLLWQRRFVQSALVALGAVLLLASAVRIIPTLRNRWDYMKWTYADFQRGYRGGIYSDLGRVLSYDVGRRVIGRHPLTGVGGGDMLPAMQSEYTVAYPAVAPENRLLPHNQFMVAALGAGLLCGILLLIWALLPVIQAPAGRDGFFLRAAGLLLLIPLLTDTFLEVQVGVGVYVLTIGWHCLLARSCSKKGQA